MLAGTRVRVSLAQISLASTRRSWWRIEMPLAGIGSRFIALLVDYLIWGAGMVVVFIAAIVLSAGVAHVQQDFGAMGRSDCHFYLFSVELGLFHDV